jgi:hypothetical protein
MLRLEPPFLESGDLVIFRDDTDDRCFYYVNQQPHISRDAGGRPAIHAYTILPGSGTDIQGDAYLEAGLSMDVDLAPGEKELSDAQECIRKAYGLTPRILVPAPLHGGKVRFIMAQAGEEANPDKWFVTSEATPSLIGNNRVSLVVRTTGREAQMLIASLMDGSTPATVCYELELTGITPVYHARIEAKKGLVYERIRNYKKDSMLFFKKEIDELMEDLREENVLKIEVKETDPDIKSTVMATLFEELSSQIVSAFFEPVSLDRAAESKGALRDLVDGVSDLVQSLLPGHCVLKSSLEIDRESSFIADLTEQDAKTHPVYPKSSLKGMLENDGIDMSSGLVSWIYLDKLPVFSQAVNIRVASDTFENSNIKSMVVQCRVRDLDTGTLAMMPESMAFSADRLQWDFVFNREKDHNYAYEYQVIMHVADTEDGLIDTEVSVTGDKWMQSLSSYVFINPATFFRNLDLDLMMADYTVFDYASLVEAEVSVIPEGGGDVLFHRTYQFTEADDDSHKRLNLLVRKDTPLQFRIHLQYEIKTGEKPAEADFLAVDGAIFRIPNPFVNRWSVDLYCYADWERVLMVYLDTRIYDPGRPDPVRDHFTFQKGREQDTMHAAVSRESPERVFEYKVTRVDKEAGKDGSGRISAGWYRHPDSPDLVINADGLTPERIVRFRIADPGSIGYLGIQKPKVCFKYDDAPEETMVFPSPDSVLEFSCPEKASCSYKLLMRNSSGASLIPSRWRPVAADCDTLTLNLLQLKDESI